MRQCRTHLDIRQYPPHLIGQYWTETQMLSISCRGNPAVYSNNTVQLILTHYKGSIIATRTAILQQQRLHTIFRLAGYYSNCRSALLHLLLKVIICHILFLFKKISLRIFGDLLRYLADSNRRTRFCRPLTKPLIQGTKKHLVSLCVCKGMYIFSKNKRETIFFSTKNKKSNIKAYLSSK